MKKMPDFALFKKENIVFNYIKMCDTKRKCYLKMATKLKSGLIKWGGGVRVVLLLKWPYFRQLEVSLNLDG